MIRPLGFPPTLKLRRIEIKHPQHPVGQKSTAKPIMRPRQGGCLTPFLGGALLSLDASVGDILMNCPKNVKIWLYYYKKPPWSLQSG